MDAHPAQTPLAVGPEIFSFFYSMLKFVFFSFYFLFCGRGPSQVTHPTPTTKTNPQPTNTMSTQMENLTRETSTPLHQLLSDKKIKKTVALKMRHRRSVSFLWEWPPGCKIVLHSTKDFDSHGKVHSLSGKMYTAVSKIFFFSRVKNCTLMLKCLIKKKFSVDVFCLDNRLEELYLRQAGSAVVNCTFE